MCSLAEKNTIDHGVNFTLRLPQLIIHPENIKVGDQVFINKGLSALAYAEISIEDNVMLGPNVSLLTSGHDPDLSGIEAQESRIIEPIKIKKGSWIGANTTIISGVIIGENTVIGAGSIVTKSVAPNSIAAGNPCKVIRLKK